MRLVDQTLVNFDHGNRQDLEAHRGDPHGLLHQSPPSEWKRTGMIDQIRAVMCSRKQASGFRRRIREW